MKKSYPPDVIDAAALATLRMILRGKAISWQGHQMYSAGGYACINGQPVGDAVDAVFVWFMRYSTADPRMSHWFENTNTVAFLKRRYL
jgi:hypothetical protein